MIYRLVGEVSGSQSGDSNTGWEGRARNQVRNYTEERRRVERKGHPAGRGASGIRGVSGEGDTLENCQAAGLTYQVQY